MNENPLPAPQPVFDTTSLSALTGGEPALLLRLVEEVLRSSRNDRAALLTVDDRQRGPLLDLVHSILGAARMVGASAVASACEALELAARPGSGYDLDAHRDQLIVRMQQLEQALQRTQRQIAGRKKPPG